MKGLRPFGMDKHFYMAFIVENFKSRTGLNVTADALWDHIEELYNINLLTESDPSSEDFRKKIDYSLSADFNES